MRPYRFAAPMLAGLAAVVLTVWPGCSQQPPQAADPAQARQFLSSALDSWKEGGKPADRVAAIHFLKRSPAEAVYLLGSGDYEFAVQEV